MTSITIDIGEIERRLIEAATEALDETAQKVATRARALAPVRHVFKNPITGRGFKNTVRFKSAEEISGDRAIRAKMGLAPEILATPVRVASVRSAGIHPKSSTSIGGEVFGFARTNSRSGRVSRRFPFRDIDARQVQFDETTGKPSLVHQQFNAALTSRGTFELKSGRAIHTRAVESTFGGALRDSIHPIHAELNDSVIEARVVAGGEDAPYAKYQELGTRHNAAHPFLRPALEEKGPALVDRLARQIAKELGR